MRENRPYGSEGGVAKSHPDPYPMERTGRSAQYGFAYCALRCRCGPCGASASAP